VCSTQEEEEDSDIVLSTAHKAKGREWESVRLAPDFLSSRLNGSDPNAEAEVRLFYVAMTRAKNRLSVDPEMLATFTSGEWKKRKLETPLARGPAPSVPRPQPSPTRDDGTINTQQRPSRPRATTSQATFSDGVNVGTASKICHTGRSLLRQGKGGRGGNSGDNNRPELRGTSCGNSSFSSL